MASAESFSQILSALLSMACCVESKCLHAALPTLTPLVQVTADAAADLPPPDALKEGGDSASQRKCTFMELALCLAPGLSVAGIEILYKAIKPALQVGSSCLCLQFMDSCQGLWEPFYMLGINLSPAGLA